jgi:hypothetical protein
VRGVRASSCAVSASCQLVVVLPCDVVLCRATQAGLSAATFNLQPEELDALSAAYEDVKVVDAEGKAMVGWRRFVGDIDLIFTVPELEKDPDADVPVR